MDHASLMVPDFRLLFEATPSPCLILDPDLIIIEVNKSYLNATMTARDKIIGHYLFEIFPDNPNDVGATGVANLRISLNNVLQNRKPDIMAIQKYDIRKPESSEFEVRYWSPINTPVLGKNGEILFIIHRAEDVTQFVLLNQQENQQSQITEAVKSRTIEIEAEIYRRGQELQEANHRLKMVNEELESFSYSVSHDLRAPLRSIVGFSTILFEDYEQSLDPDAKESLMRVINAAKRMGQLIDGLLDLSRLTRAELQNNNVNLSEIVKETTDDLHRVYPSRNVTVTIAENIIVKGDPRLLRAAIENLINNAWKFTAKNPNAQIEFGKTEKDGKEIYFLRDNGVGFEMRHKNKLFGIFQRLHSASEFPGSGIGLATVQRIFHRHGGTIWAEAALDKGATFYFYL